MAITARGKDILFTLQKRGYQPTDIVNAAHELSRLGRAATTYARIQEIWCSVELSERQTAKLEQREQRLENLIKSIAASLELIAVFQGDPRGYTVRLKMSNWHEEDYIGAA